MQKNIIRTQVRKACRYTFLCLGNALAIILQQYKVIRFYRYRSEWCKQTLASSS